MVELTARQQELLDELLKDFKGDATPAICRVPNQTASRL